MEHKIVHAVAASLVGVFLDDRLLDAVRAYVREHYELPDIMAITQQVYGEEGTH